MAESVLGTPNPLPFATGLRTADYLVVFAYMLGLIAVGAYLARRQKTTEDFFVGDRRMPWLIVGVSMLATLMSTLTYLGLPGELIRHGVAIATGLIATPLAFLVIGYVWVPFFMRLRLTSAYEYLERRFGKDAKMLGVALYLYMRFVWVGAILYSMSLAVAEITKESGPRVLSELSSGAIALDENGWFYFVIVITGVVCTAYTTLGGIKGLIWIDLIHFVALFTGAVVTLATIAVRTGTGPATWWTDATQVAHKLPPLGSWDLSFPRTVLWIVLTDFAWNVCTHASDQVALQLYFTTRSVADARRTAAVNYVLNAAMLGLLALVGMALLTFFLRMPDELPPGVTDQRSAEFADKMFPYFIAHSLPTGLAGLVVAGVFAVAQSSIDSGINSTVTVITVDLISKLRGRAAGPANEVWLARWLTVALGAVVTLTAIAISLTIGKYNIIDMQLKSFNSVLGPLGAIFMAGILMPHVGQRAVLAAGLIGAATGVLLGFGDLIPGVTTPTSFLVIPLSWLVTFTLAAMLGGLLPGLVPEQVRGLTWQSVMRGEGERCQEGQHSGSPQ